MRKQFAYKRNKQFYNKRICHSFLRIFNNLPESIQQAFGLCLVPRISQHLNAALDIHARTYNCLYRVTLVVAYLGWVDLNLDVQLSAGFCLGRWEFGRTGYTSGKDNGTSKSKSTQPK